MPLDHSPVKTRSTKVGGDKRPADKQSTVHRALSDSAIAEPISEEMRLTIQAAVEAALTNVTVIGNLVDLVASRVSASVSEQLQATLQQALGQIDKINEDLKVLNRGFDEHKTECARRCDEIEQYQRRNNLRVFGIAESGGEDTDTLVIDLFKSKLNVDVQLVDIDRSHRVGRPPRAGPDGNVRPRPIIVKFVSYRTRREVFNNKKRLKGSGVTVREDLTPHRLGLLREAARVHGATRVWTLDGRICWLTADNQRGTATWTL